MAGTTIVAASVNRHGITFEVGGAQRLFDVRVRIAASLNPGPGSVSDVSADGQRFLISQIAGESAKPPIRVITNWTSAIKP